VARDLFSDVAQSSAKVGSRAGYTVPLSILTHSAVAAIVIFGPLLAPMELPTPSAVMTLIMPKQPEPPPMPPTQRTASSPRTPAATAMPTAPEPAAPIAAPTTISNDTEAGASVPGPVIATGSPGPDLGSVPGIAAGPQVLPAPAPTVMLRTGGRIRNPQKTRHVPPVYPAIAVANRVEGSVTIEAIIGVDGRVKDARVVQSIPLLDQAALAAVKQWQFSPTLLNGVAVPVIMSVTVNFTLH
jgi:periplasmic protein TonB